MPSTPNKSKTMLYVLSVCLLILCFALLTACNVETYSFEEVSGFAFDDASATYSTSKYQSAAFACPQNFLDKLNCQYRCANIKEAAVISQHYENDSKDFNIIIRVNDAYDQSKGLTFYIVNNRIYVESNNIIYVSLNKTDFIA